MDYYWYSETALLMRATFYILYSERFKSNTFVDSGFDVCNKLMIVDLCVNMTRPQATQIAS